MSVIKPDEWICRENCSYYKPNRIELERCRGYTLATDIFELKPPIQPHDEPEAFDPLFEKSFLRSNVCEACPFYIDDCDFTSVTPPKNCLPCGGLIALSKALKGNRLGLADVRLANLKNLGDRAYLRISDEASLKQLEQPHIYSIVNDELYEVNEDGYQFSTNCNGLSTVESLCPDREFLEFCVSEGLVSASGRPDQKKMVLGTSPDPSLRYLEWLVTYRCNLKCAHCYLGEDRPEDFPEHLIVPLLQEFSAMQGLRVLVSGGEPTLYRGFRKLNELIPQFPLRFVLLSNGMVVDDNLTRLLNFHEIQISLDGMEKGHESIRGNGSFQRALKAMESIKNAGLDLSIATMIHSGNLDEWEDMRQLLESFEIREWSIDYPCVKGRFQNHPELEVDVLEAARRMEYGFGGSYHGASAGWTCGRHLVAVLPNGDVCRCGLYPEKRLGTVQDGLLKAWKNVGHIPIEATKCKGCGHSSECGGGCRYRAGGHLERDLIMCALYGEPVEP